MARNNNGEERERKKFKPVKGEKAELAALRGLKLVNKEINKRFEVSEKLFKKRDKFRQQLGIEL